MLGIFGRCSLSGCRAILQRGGPEFSCQPVSTGMPRESLTTTAAGVNITVQSESQSWHTPIKVWRNPGMICHVNRNPQGSLGEFSSPMPVDCWDWTVAVPPVTFGAERSMLNMGASSEN